MLQKSICLLLFGFSVGSLLDGSRLKPKKKSRDQEMIEDAPWRIKLILLNDPGSRIPWIPSMDGKQAKFSSLYRNMTSILSRFGNYTKLDIKRRQAESSESSSETEEEDTSDYYMRMEIFKLMQETIIEANSFMRRAEIMRNKYLTKSDEYFDVGFLNSEIEDKYNIMMSFVDTLDKMYDLWKPVEHMNAYEQIMNYSLEINHLIETLLVVVKSKG